MLKYYNLDIVFQEIPNEVSLAINITNCPNHCKGCHSPHLQEDIGEELTKSVLSDLLEKYGNAVTCVCFMGGDNAPEEILQSAKFFRKYGIKTAWYSGKKALPNSDFTQYFNYIKLGAYIESLGGLDSPTTNQRLYRIENGEMFVVGFK
ncbi:MAG: anaerobic ribonucleoside-triphosphate reductase activating protein [Candidatus Symbiothrix sp.]|jgi:anaerobic ribonucleoside-triphosphate reductase activating protein|nr:anaerobic ribonucleoside-triphosphate reductase activating protein [Candidatus Symbiothrix sp.]